MTTWSLVTVAAGSEPFVAARVGDGSLRSGCSRRCATRAR